MLVAVIAFKMAQVYKENLEEVLPDMEAAIASCDFIALDFEMSGISVKDKRRHPNYNDSPQVQSGHVITIPRVLFGAPRSEILCRIPRLIMRVSNSVCPFCRRNGMKR